MIVRLLHKDSSVDSSKWIQDFEYFESRWKSQSIFPIFTSGSTGQPKKIQHTKVSMIKSAQLTIDRFGLEDGYTSFLCLPIKFIAGQLMYVRSYVRDGFIDVVEPSIDPWNYINKKYDFVAMTPMQFSNGLKNNRTKVDLIKILLLGGAPISEELQAKIDQLDSPCQIFHSYGMTETITHIAVRAINGPQKSEYFDVLKGISISVSNSGTLIVEADHLDLSPIVTSDLVELRNERSFKWISRIDDVINSGGLKIHPFKLESALKPLLLEDFFISSINDELLGQKVVMVIKKDRNEDFMMALMKSMKKKLDKKQIPKSFYFVKEFLFTETGKLIKDLTRYDLA